VAAAAEAARALPFPFTFVARAENYLHGVRDLDDTLRRLVAFEAAGADVLFAPGLPDLAAIRTVCSSLRKPVNVVAGIGGLAFPLADLEAAGVRRVSTGSTLVRAALTGLRDAAAEINESGSFGFLDRLMSGAELTAAMRGE
jgi:2-methylisocitrate lyase-like PEP mutase family enzyme